jgi:hypothetical protein
MIERTDELCDDFWTESELHQMAIDALVFDKYEEVPTHIVFYHLFKEGNKTGLVLITAVKSVIDGQEAIDKLWAEVGITAIVGEYNDESYLNQIKLDALHLLLSKYKYKGKINLPCSEKVVQYQEWMSYLL